MLSYFSAKTFDKILIKGTKNQLILRNFNGEALNLILNMTLRKRRTKT